MKGSAGRIRKTARILVSYFLVVLVPGSPVATLGATGVDHSILWIVDGFHPRLLDRLPLPHLRALAARGVLVRHVEGMAPFHPHHGRWLDFHSSSLPNPVLLAGTALIDDETQYIHQVFQDLKRPTAHATNSGYFSLNQGFTYSYVDETGTGRDEDALYWARQFLSRGRPAYLRIHMQDLGTAARASYRAQGDEPWADDIWANGSPYLRTAETADRLVGEFVAWLKQEGFYDRSLICLTADHGMSRVGRHPYWDPDSSKTILIMVGPGVREGVELEYADSIDIVPTLAHLAGVAAPAGARGIVLSEALTDPPESSGRREIPLSRLNELLLAYDRMIDRAFAAAQDDPPLYSHLEVLDNRFYGVRDFGEWSHFSSLREVYEHNREIYEQVQTLAHQLGVR